MRFFVSVDSNRILSGRRQLQNAPETNLDIIFDDILRMKMQLYFKMCYLFETAQRCICISRPPSLWRCQPHPTGGGTRWTTCRRNGQKIFTWPPFAMEERYHKVRSLWLVCRVYISTARFMIRWWSFEGQGYC